MATDKQIAANRLNAQKSTGPKTPEGRAAVRLNGVTHGLTAETIVLRGESESDFKALLDSLEAEHAPASPTEEALVQQLAMATWRLYHQEGGFYAYKMKEHADSQEHLKLTETERMGLIADWSHKTLDMFSRQEGRLQRSSYRALHELERLHNPNVSAGAAEPSDLPAAAPPADAPAPPESNLASVLPTPSHNPNVSAEADQPNTETNDIQPPPDPEISQPAREIDSPAAGHPFPRNTV